MRDVFVTQSTRRFVHEFTLLETIMKLWIFDRFDSYSSELFNIHKKSEKFIKAIAEYMMMNDKELDLNTFIEQRMSIRSITIFEDVTEEKKRLRLKSDFIVYQQAIVCRDTSCFLVKTSDLKNSQYVVKFSWIFDKWSSEADFLRLARKRKVREVTKLFDHHCIISIAKMREEFTFMKLHTFQSITLSTTFFFSQSQSQTLLHRSFSQLRELSIVNDSSKKRKSVNVEEKSFKRSRFNNQRSDKIKQKREVTNFVKDTQTTSLYALNESSFDNRVFHCLIISLTSREIRDFQSTSYSRPDSLSHQSWWLREILPPLGRRRLAESPTPGQSVTSLELLLDTLWWRTFADEDCRADRGQFNGSKIPEKYEGLTQQMGSGILRVGAARSPSCQHLPPPGLISARWLPHILWET